jgi:phosphomannomutase
VRAIGNAEFINGTCKRIYGSFKILTNVKKPRVRLQSLNNLPGVVFQYLIYTDGTDNLKYVTKGKRRCGLFRGSTTEPAVRME